MKIHAMIALIRARYHALPERQQPIALASVVVIGLLLLIALLKGCVAIFSHKQSTTSTPVMIRHGRQIEIPKNSPLRSQLALYLVKTSPAPHRVSFPGVVEADPSQVVNVLPPLAGRLIKLPVKLGDFVKKNQLLAVIRSPDLAQAYADYERAISLLKLSDEALQRARKVNQAGANAIKDIEMAENNFDQAHAELKRSQSRLKSLGSNTFSQLNIKSPMDGQVTALNYGLGSYITDPLATLMTVTNTKKSILVTANIPEIFIGAVAKGQQADVELSALPKQILHGRISFVNTVLDPDSRRNKTRLVFANPDAKLQPNMFATVTIAIPQAPIITVPISSILMNDDMTSVYIQIAPWVFEPRQVELGAEDGDTVRILSGLKPRDRIVMAGGVFIND